MKRIVAVLSGLAILVGIGIYGYHSNAYGPVVNSYEKAVAEETGQFNALSDQIKVAEKSLAKCSSQKIVLQECKNLANVLKDAKNIQQTTPVEKESPRSTYKRSRQKVVENTKQAKRARELIENALKALREAEKTAPSVTEPSEKPSETETEADNDSDEEAYIPEEEEAQDQFVPAPQQPEAPAPASPGNVYPQPAPPAPAPPEEQPEPPHEPSPPQPDTPAPPEPPYGDEVP
ncbi:hypothetical protein [Gleimia europaea]|uniref:Uncharacterized protein n=1 Tax=Gleimia europaea ACS-120-V-Col10b TaxID=883069 RepID=A0A9W5REX0_9ACTO|nr:hypothetical protein [Gleimia europaea]EPD31050.1 hypothetical protein HMPREF9238_00807 [Gleimia europaea ACS-120-V-Col10b]